MSYRADTDLEFLATISKEDLKGLARVITHDNDGSERLGQMLSQANPNSKNYWKDVAEQIQTYGANTVMTIFRFGHGVSYREVLKDVCDKLDVNYEKSSSTSYIEKCLLDKILNDAWFKLSDQEKKRLLISVNIPYSPQMMTGAGLTALSALMSTGSILAYRLTAMVVLSVTGALAPLLGNTALAFVIGRGAGWLLGPLGWGLTVLSIAGPAYRVTVPACATVALLRKKYKLTPAERLRLEKADQLAKKLADELEKTRKNENKCIALYMYYYKIQEIRGRLEKDAIIQLVFGESGIYDRNRDKINRLVSNASFCDSVQNARDYGISKQELKDRLEVIISFDEKVEHIEQELLEELNTCYDA
ncbi:MAG: DUF3944 domain-containing protein [Mailhella sp.]|nr:DUF3944 domain-containing protein [Mailhella sp.]